MHKYKETLISRLISNKITSSKSESLKIYTENNLVVILTAGELSEALTDDHLLIHTNG